MSDRAQIESDAILARRLQEDEQRHMANLRRSGHSARPDPNPAPIRDPAPAPPPPMYAHPENPFQSRTASHYPFAQGTESSSPADRMDEMFNRIAASAGISSAQGLREEVLRGIEDDSIRPSVLRSDQPLPSLPAEHAFSSLEQFYERNRRNVEQGMRFPTQAARDRPRSNIGSRRSGLPYDMDHVGADFFNEVASSFGSINVPGGRQNHRHLNSTNYGLAHPMPHPRNYPQQPANATGRRGSRNVSQDPTNSNNPSDTTHHEASARATLFGTPQGFAGGFIEGIAGQGLTAMAGNFSEITRMIQSAVTSGQGLDPEVTAQMQEMMRAAVSGIELAGDGEGSYEDWLNLIDRMGGNVNRSATDEEMHSLTTKKFEKPRASSSLEGVAGPSRGASASSSTPVETEKCSICLLEFDDGDDVKCMPCSHIFHPECLDRWLKINRTCPVCKQSLRPDDGPAA